MLSGNESEVPLGATQDRSSTGIEGPSQIPVDDDELGIDVADSTIVDLEDGFTFQRTAPPSAIDLVGRIENFVHDVLQGSSGDDVKTSFLETNWLVDQGES
jgi:hypothetical protein